MSKEAHWKPLAQNTWRVMLLAGHRLPNFEIDGKPVADESEANYSSFVDAEWRAYGYLLRIIDGGRAGDILRKEYTDFSDGQPYRIIWPEGKTRPEWTISAEAMFMNDATGEVRRTTMEYEYGSLKHDEVPDSPEESATEKSLRVEMLARRDDVGARRRELRLEKHWLAETEEAYRGEPFNERNERLLARLRFVTAAEQSYAEATKAYEKALENYENEVFRTADEHAADDEEEVEP